MKSIKVKSKSNQIIISHKLEKNEHINSIELNIINKCEIPALMPTQVHSGISGKQIRFIIIGYIDLVSYLQSSILFDEFLNVVLKIVETIQSCESHGIRTSNLELHPQYIYYDYNQREVKMLYWPIISPAEYVDLQNFFKLLGEVYLCRDSEREFQADYLGYFDSRIKFDIYHFEKTIIVWKKKWAEQDVWTVPNMMSDDIGNPSIRHIESDTVIELRKFPFTIGRIPQLCDYAIQTDHSISKVHLTINQKNYKIYAYDNNTSNGTMVNGYLIPKNADYELHSNYKIEIGTQHFVYYEAGGLK